jgi:hypothetical protein
MHRIHWFVRQHRLTNIYQKTIVIDKQPYLTIIDQKISKIKISNPTFDATYKVGVDQIDFTYNNNLLYQVLINNIKACLRNNNGDITYITLSL